MYVPKKKRKHEYEIEESWSTREEEISEEGSGDEYE